MSRQFLDQALRSVNTFFSKRQNLSFQTQRDYRLGLKLVVRTLHNKGVQISDIRHLRERHVDLLLEDWREKRLSNATIKNRLAQIRYVSNQDPSKSHILLKQNGSYVDKRSYISAESKAIKDIDAGRIGNPLVRYSVLLQQHFGLRREEAIKFIPSIADKGDFIALEGSWTKGGKSRIIPVTKMEQRAILNEVKQFLKPGKALIPENRNYAYQKKMYESAVEAAGFSNLHGLRHAYAQERYKALTTQLSAGNGWACPFDGGMIRKGMSAFEKEADITVRKIISRELGHSRVSITNIYLGS